jgi:hypothetical protein
MEILQMETLERIVQVDRASGGLLIFFHGGKVAFYSESLLCSVLPQAQELTECDSGESSADNPAGDLLLFRSSSCPNPQQLHANLRHINPDAAASPLADVGLHLLHAFIGGTAGAE